MIDKYLLDNLNKVVPVFDVKTQCTVSVLVRRRREDTLRLAVPYAYAVEHNIITVFNQLVDQQTERQYGLPESRWYYFPLKGPICRWDVPRNTVLGVDYE